MAKRKSAVNDIIYELDNDDITLSSDDEAKQPKLFRKEAATSPEILQTDSASQDSASEVIDVDSSVDIINCDAPSPIEENGGKSVDDLIIIDDDAKKSTTEAEISAKNVGTDGNNTTIFHVESPHSPCNSDLGVVGCENRTPLVTVRFKDSKLAMNYKKQLKAFMISLIKLHENDDNSDNETDIELDIWPEDLENNVEPEEDDNGFFFVDTAPCENHEFVPAYNSVKDETVLLNKPIDIPVEAPVFRRGPTCFNCEGDHPIRDCKQPKNYVRINEMRKKMNMNKRTGRYHMEDDQKFGHMLPGRISGRLRDALGLKRSELPLHVYRMRMLGYPPAWLEEARISHSGISLFDSSGRATLEPDEEEGEVNEPGSKDKFEIKKIWDFPGFNIPASKRYRDESQYLNMPPMSEQDSKLAMLQVLAPNAMKAYKRKKLTYFPSAAADTCQGGQAEMEIDSGDETLDFPSAPPLPDEVPPPQPPPPASLPPLPPGSPPPSDDAEVGAIPIPIADMIVLDETGDGDTPEPSSGRNSPSLDDLEVKKKALLDALLNVEAPDTTPASNGSASDLNSSDKNKDPETEPQSDDTTEELETEGTIDTETVPNAEPEKEDNQEAASSSSQIDIIDNAELPKTPQAKSVRTDYGAPFISSVTPYNKLPSDDKFAKDICDVINFENLPNSTGKYKRISTLLKKVKDEVDRIQDS